MLTARHVILAAAGLALAALASACGASTHEGATAANVKPAAATQDFGACSAAAADPEVTADSTTLTLVKSVPTTAADLTAWLTSMASAGAPSRGLSSYTDLGSLTSATPMTVCVFQTDDRAIPLPSEVTTQANGVRVFVSSTGTHQIDAIGDVTRLTKQLSSLATN